MSKNKKETLKKVKGKKTGEWSEGKALKISVVLTYSWREFDTQI